MLNSFSVCPSCSLSTSRFIGRVNSLGMDSHLQRSILVGIVSCPPHTGKEVERNLLLLPLPPVPHPVHSPPPPPHHPHEVRGFSAWLLSIKLYVYLVLKIGDMVQIPKGKKSGPCTLLLGQHFSLRSELHPRRAPYTDVCTFSNKYAHPSLPTPPAKRDSPSVLSHLPSREDPKLRINPSSFLHGQMFSAFLH